MRDFVSSLAQHGINIEEDKLLVDDQLPKATSDIYYEVDEVRLFMRMVEEFSSAHNFNEYEQGRFNKKNVSLGIGSHELSQLVTLSRHGSKVAASVFLPDVSMKTVSSVYEIIHLIDAINLSLTNHGEEDFKYLTDARLAKKKSLVMI